MSHVVAPRERPTRVAFLESFVDIDHPLDLVRRRLGGDSAWLVRLAEEAAQDGEALLVHLSPSSTHRRLGVPARVRLDRWSDHGKAMLAPIRWEAWTFSGLFPVLDGNLVLSAVTPSTSRLGLCASYRPPLDVIGEWLDRLLLHRVAESTARSFLERVGSTIDEEVTGQSSADEQPG